MSLSSVPGGKEKKKGRERVISSIHMSKGEKNKPREAARKFQSSGRERYILDPKEGIYNS